MKLLEGTKDLIQKGDLHRSHNLGISETDI